MGHPIEIAEMNPESQLLAAPPRMERDIILHRVAWTEPDEIRIFHIVGGRAEALNDVMNEVTALRGLRLLTTLLLIALSLAALVLF
jgi:hypothetical protein